MVNDTRNSLGEVIRAARVAKGLGLRELAREAVLTPSYLSDIENDRRVPAEEVLRTISTHLDLDFDDLMARAGRLGDEAMRYIGRTPAVGILMRKLSAANTPAEVIEKITRDIDRKTGRPKGDS